MFSLLAQGKKDKNTVYITKQQQQQQNTQAKWRSRQVVHLNDCNKTTKARKVSSHVAQNAQIMTATNKTKKAT